MPKTPAQKKAQDAYMQKFKRLNVRVDPDLFDQVKDHADRMGDNSMTAFVTRAIVETIARERKIMGWE